MAKAATETSDLLARSQRLEALLAHTNSNLRQLEEQLTSSEAIAAFGHFKIDAQDRFLLSRSAQALLGPGPASAPSRLASHCHRLRVPPHGAR